MLVCLMVSGSRKRGQRGNGRRGKPGKKRSGAKRKKSELRVEHLECIVYLPVSGDEKKTCFLKDAFSVSIFRLVFLSPVVGIQ